MRLFVPFVPFVPLVPFALVPFVCAGLAACDPDLRGGDEDRDDREDRDGDDDDSAAPASTNQPRLVGYVEECDDSELVPAFALTVELDYESDGRLLERESTYVDAERTETRRDELRWFDEELHRIVHTRTSADDENESSTVFAYADGRLVGLTQPDVEAAFAYTGGALSSSTVTMSQGDGLTRNTSFEHDGLGRLVSIASEGHFGDGDTMTSATAIDHAPNGLIAGVSYEAAGSGNLVVVAGAEWTAEYEGERVRELLQSFASEDGTIYLRTTITYEYDDDGRIASAQSVSDWGNERSTCSLSLAYADGEATGIDTTPTSLFASSPLFFPGAPRWDLRGRPRLADDFGAMVFDFVSW